MSMNTLQNISRLSHIEIISMFKIMQNLHSFKVLFTQSHPTLCDHVDYSLPGSSVHRTLQARILEWVAISFSRGSSWLRDLVQVSFIADRFFTVWVTFRFSSVTQSSLTAAPWIAALQASSPSPTSGVHSNSRPLSRWCMAPNSDAIQPSHPLSSPFPPVPNPAHHQSLFQWVNSSHEVAKVLVLQL